MDKKTQFGLMLTIIFFAVIGIGVLYEQTPALIVFVFAVMFGIAITSGNKKQVKRAKRS